MTNTSKLSVLPSWYVSPEQQLERVHQLNVQQDWGFSDSDFPSIPESFVPRTETEVCKLTVYLSEKCGQSGLQRSFDEFWNLIEVPNSYTKWRSSKLKSDSGHLRLVPGYSHRPGIRWVRFDPNAYHGLSADAAREQSKTDGVHLAGVEILMAVLLFPTWITSWNGNTSPYPNMSGLQSDWNSWSKVVDWSDAPFLLPSAEDRKVYLSMFWADLAGDDQSSPTVGEC